MAAVCFGIGEASVLGGKKWFEGARKRRIDMWWDRL